MIEVADIDADSEEKLDDIETPDVQRRKAATKQCLRWVPLHLGGGVMGVTACCQSL